MPTLKMNCRLFSTHAWQHYAMSLNFGSQAVMATALLVDRHSPQKCKRTCSDYCIVVYWLVYRRAKLSGWGGEVEAGMSKKRF
jgi:hypothetical protein